jgi:hypothetical protein
MGSQVGAGRLLAADGVYYVEPGPGARFDGGQFFASSALHV